MLGLALAINPISATKAHAAVSPRVSVGALRIAASEIGVAYVWGGTRPWTGFDCSGLVQYSYARVGRHLPRTAQEQYNATIHIRRSAARSGDLVFFYSGTTIFHDGIYAGRGYIVHAPHSHARVRLAHLWTSHVLFGRVR